MTLLCSSVQGGTEPAGTESGALVRDYVSAFTSVLGQVLGTAVRNPEQAAECIRDRDDLPLGFRGWFLKHGVGMLSRLFSAEFRGEASDQFLDELDYYVMVLRDCMGEGGQDKEAACSDLAASLTRLSRLFAAESCHNNCFLTGL